MNKKIVGIILSVVLVAAVGIGYITLNNSKQEVKVEPAPIVNQKDDKGNVIENKNVPDKMKQIGEAKDFLHKGLAMSFDVSDLNNKKVVNEITEYQKANFEPTLITQINGMYDVIKKSGSKYEITEFLFKKVDSTVITTKSGERMDGYSIEYTIKMKRADGTIDTIKDKNSTSGTSTALVSVKDGRFRLEQLSVSKE